MPQRKHGLQAEELLKEGCHRLNIKKRNGGKINIKQTSRDLDILLGLWRESPE